MKSEEEKECKSKETLEVMLVKPTLESVRKLSAQVNENQHKTLDIDHNIFESKLNSDSKI